MKVTKTEQYILDHLAPVDFGFYHDTYLCGVSVENKNIFIYTINDKTKEWVEKNGGKYIRLSDKVISHSLNKKGFVVQIYFPRSDERDMKNIMASLFTKDMQRVYIKQ